MTDFTVHFQKGVVVGARSLRMEHVEADTPAQAIRKAKALFPDHRAQGFRLTRVDHWDEDEQCLVID